ncbi:hypothetical protein BFJ68_g15880 [Fusarium oxysporum]|uniref:Uncharacterized protein n=1 Tax=Fusarium oxysporum TaxID=5507 RepID=A0A420PIW6_FUSOX|nr:hypothetical protein BFJ68_g15880 [Fusarium oxysporum]
MGRRTHSLEEKRARARERMRKQRVKQQHTNLQIGYTRVHPHHSTASQMNDANSTFLTTESTVAPIPVFSLQSA